MECYTCLEEIAVDGEYWLFDGKYFCCRECVFAYVEEDIERGMLEPEDLIDRANISEHMFDLD